MTLVAQESLGIEIERARRRVRCGRMKYFLLQVFVDRDCVVEELRKRGEIEHCAAVLIVIPWPADSTTNPATICGVDVVLYWQ